MATENERTNGHFNLTDPYAIARYIKKSEKSTPVKVYVNGKLKNAEAENIQKFGCECFWILFGEYTNVTHFLQKYKNQITDYVIENDRRNSAIPLLDLKKINARIEPGAIIRNGVKIGNNAVIMMGAIINIGSEIGDGSMIDMNAVLGARAIVGKNVHVGAGAVIAGVLEPPSVTRVIIEDNAMIGANAVILEGVKVGQNAVVAAGSIVTKDVPENSVVAGSPAKIIKTKDEKTADKTKLLDELRG
jgi:2,3,4,5-tetrahydropyridine-2,6-dicarboxylate N-acetyltransferase